MKHAAFVIALLVGCGQTPQQTVDPGTVDSGGSSDPSTPPDSPSHADWYAVPPFTGQDFRDVDVQGPLIVAVGNFGMIYTSPDGQTWTKRYEDLAENLLSVASSSAGYAAVGTSGTIVRSADGISWTAVTGIATNRLRAVARFDTGFIAVGHEIVTSVDGVTWVNRGAAPAQLTSVVEAGSTVYAVGFEGAFVYTTEDGTAWTSHTTPMPSTRDLAGICHHAGTFVAVGEQGTILTSTDGLTWAARASGTTFDLGSVSCGPLVAVGQEPTLGDPNFGTGILMTSPTGASWDVRLSAIARMRGIDARDDRAVAVGDDGTILVSGT